METWQIAVIVLQLIFFFIHAVCHIIQVVLEWQKQTKPEDNSKDN